MKNVLLLIASLVAGLCVVTSSEAAGDRVLQPPEDGRQYATIVFLNSQQCRGRHCPDSQLVQWFEHNPALRSLKNSTAFFVYTPDDPMWRSRFASTHDGQTSVWIQDYSGGVIFKKSGVNLARSAEGLVDQISSELGTLAQSREAIDPGPRYTPGFAAPPHDDEAARLLRPFGLVPDSQGIFGFISGLLGDSVFDSRTIGDVLLCAALLFAAYLFLP